MKHSCLQSWLLCALLATLIAASACQRTLDPDEFPGAEYFPLQPGQENIYHVLDTSYQSAQINGIAVRRYYQREVVAGFETDLKGREMAILDIYESPDSLGSAYQWTLKRRDQAFLGGGYAERISENTRFLLLQLPAHAQSTWNGNQFNADRAETFRLRSIDTTLVLSQVSYPGCLWVDEVPFREVPLTSSGYATVHHAYAAYAPGIGKLLRYRKEVEVQNFKVEPQSFVTWEVLVAHR